MALLRTRRSSTLVGELQDAIHIEHGRSQPKKKPMNDSHGFVFSTPSSQNPAPKPRISAITNDMPSVLSWPMSCHVVGEVGTTASV